MKTNKKDHPVWKYIIDSVDENAKLNYNLEKDLETDKDKLKFVLDTFRSEYDFEIKRRGDIVAFSEWLKGLPTAINIDFENYTILEIAKKWGSLPENPTERQEEKILANWFNFIANKFFQLCSKYKIV